MFDHAGQLLINVSQMTWARLVESGLDGQLVPDDPLGGVKTAFDKTVEDLSNLCMLVRGELTKLMRGSLVALITIDVHNRDIVEYLINDETQSKGDFNWQVREREREREEETVCERGRMRGREIGGRRGRERGKRRGRKRVRRRGREGGRRRKP